MPLDLTTNLERLGRAAQRQSDGQAGRGPEFFEYRVTDYLEALFKRLGVPCQRQTVEPKRDNIVARLDGRVPAGRRGRAAAVRGPSRHGAGRRHDDRALDAPCARRPDVRPRLVRHQRRA